MKAKNLYLFDIDAIIQTQVDGVEQRITFVNGFETFVKQLTGKIIILMPYQQAEKRESILALLKTIHLQDHLVFVHSVQEIYHYLNLSYQQNRYFFSYGVELDKRHIQKPTALFSIDKNDDLLPEMGWITVKDFRAINHLFS